MYATSKPRRIALAAIAVGSLTFLAACGGDTSAADGGDAGSGDSTESAAADGGGGTIAFSPIALSIPAMKGLSEGVTHYGEEQGYKVIVQDPNLDPQKQVTDLTSVVESGAVDGAWAIMIAPPAAAPLVQTALDKDVPLILNGTPADYGLEGLEPGISFSTIDYVAQGTAMGEELGNCINEKLDGKAEVLYGESAAGTAGKAEQDKAIKAALAATAPDAEIVSTIIISDRAKAQTDVGAALQGNPEHQRRDGPERRGLARRPRRLRRRRQGAALPDRDRRQRGGPGRGQGRQDLRLRRPAVRGRHGAVVRRPRRDDRRPRGDRRAADRAPGSREGRQLTIMSTPDVTQTSDQADVEAGATSPGPAPVPTGNDVPRSVSVLVFLRDRGIFILWGLLILFFAFWASPYFFTMNNALLIANAGALTAIFAAGVGIGVMTGVLDLSLPGTAAIASCVCGWLLTHDYATWVGLLAGLACGVAVGLVNGFITLRGFNPIIVTIGTLSVLTGLAAVVAGGYTFPGLTQLEFMGTHRYFRIGETGETFAGIPAPVFIVAVVFIVGTVFLTRTRDGLRLMAVGANAEAVRRAGIHSDRYKVVGFVISGLLAAVGGLVNTANVTEANPNASPAILFTALTAVALAGVALTGGRGSLPRVLVGALILATIANGLTIRGIQPYWAIVATGALLLGSLMFERALQTAVSERLMSANLSVHAKQG